MREVDRERIKLFAAALTTAATSCFTVGIATPVAGYIYNVGGLRGIVGLPDLAMGFVGFISVAAGLHRLARRVPGGLDG